VELTFTVLWTALADGELAQLEDAMGRAGGTVQQITVGTLRGRIVKLLAQGGVILVAASDREASIALAHGVDEVMRSGRLTATTIDETVEHARMRAEIRLGPRTGSRMLADDWSAFSLLSAALGNELGGSLVVASTSCDVVRSGLTAWLGATEELARWAALAAPIEHVRRLVAMCKAAPSAEELHRIFDEAKASLSHGIDLVRTLRELSFDAGQGAVPADAMLTQLCDLLRGYVSQWAELRLDVTGPCVARVSRSSFTCLVTALIASSLDAIRASGARGRIELEASEHDGCVVVEVRHDGDAARTDLRPRLLDPVLAAPAPFDLGLVAVRERSRRLGGDLLVASDGDGATLRLILPVGNPEDHALPDGWDLYAEPRELD
jgi:hypothetical protein